MQSDWANWSDASASGHDYDSSAGNESVTTWPCPGSDDADDCLFLSGELSEFLERRLGHARLPDSELIPITAVYSILFLTGMLGNIVTIYVISHVRYMHTATNLYLTNLAVTDILSLTVSMTHELITFWIYYPYPFSSAICKSRAFIAEAATTATVLTIMAVTIERYVAICQPLLLRSTESSSSLRRSIKVIAAIWVCSCLAAIPVTVQLDVVLLEAPYANGTMIPESAACRIEKQEQLSSDQFDPADRLWLVSFATFFVLPLTLLTVLYILIGRAIHRAEERYHRSDIAQIHAAAYRRSREEPCAASNTGIAGFPLSSSATIATCAVSNCTDRRLMHQKVKARRGVVRMLVAVVIGFFICWAPYNAERLMTVLAPKGSFNDDETFYTIRQHLFLISGVLFYVSSTINPLLYVASSAKFRRATKLALQVLVDTCSGKQQSPDSAAKRVYRSNCRANLANKAIRAQQSVRPRRFLQVPSVGGGVPAIQFPNRPETGNLRASLVSNTNVPIAPAICVDGQPQDVYHVCRFSYRYSSLPFNTAYHELPAAATPMSLNTLSLGPAAAYQKRSTADRLLGRLTGRSPQCNRPQKPTKSRRKRELQRDCVSLGELELNSRYLAAPGCSSRNSSTDSSDRRPCTLT